MAQAAAARAVTEGRDNDGAGREFSAGGIVLKDGQLLLVRARSLKGELVWTFPKGHVEPGETPREAAVREVEEETGWRCRILKSAMTARYSFRREGRRIDKRVQWYWMEAGAKLGSRDAAEIAAVRWAPPAKAAALLRYPSDLDLLKRAELFIEGRKA